MINMSSNIYLLAFVYGIFHKSHRVSFAEKCITMYQWKPIQIEMLHDTIFVKLLLALYCSMLRLYRLLDQLAVT